ncbi:hypothetical protein [Nonomuraea sp. NPDC003754]
MSTRDKLVGAATLKRLRLARGWSLSDTARAIIDAAARLGQPFDISAASVQRTVARWETGTAPVLPSERYQLLLAHLYAHGTDGRRSLGTGSDFAELLDALGQLGESERRLGELRTLLLRTTTDAGGGLLALLGPPMQRTLSVALADASRLDEGLIAAMRDAVSAVNDQVGSIPFVRLQLVLAPIVESCRRLLGSQAPRQFLPDLRSVAAQAYMLSGRFAFETRDDEASRALYIAATDAASGLGAPWRSAVVRMSHALVTLYSTPGLDAAKELVDAAVRDARAGDRPRAWPGDVRLVEAYELPVDVAVEFPGHDGEPGARRRSWATALVAFSSPGACAVRWPVTPASRQAAAHAVGSSRRSMAMGIVMATAGPWTIMSRFAMRQTSRDVILWQAPGSANRPARTSPPHC